MSYRKVITEDMRLVILRLLAEDPDYSHNEYILHRLLPGFGHAVSQDRIRTELSWLADQGLVTIEDNPTILVAKLTQRGADAAAGTAEVPGVARPRPEA